MNYKIVKLDGRWSYRSFFDYAIIFGGRMTQSEGPLNFANVQKYFFDTYGWSAEIRQWANIREHLVIQTKYIKPGKLVLPECVNPHWSWTNGYDDLRLYVKGTEELMLFQLKYPVDQ